ncbi:MAG: hypothetical protein A3K83_07975 [Omnitrophica WOR_2 bacterium RBG_13_44_8b]|nr:MAG: hypothetical protein A3K83_07975 [Omnitrophica WOR_2 bacterium RBG_13_44_8b]
MAFGSGFRSTDRAEPCKKRSHRCKAVELHNLRYVRSIAEKKNHPTIPQFLNFEAWYRAFVLNKGARLQAA